MSNAELEKFKQIIGAMTKEELTIIADIIPVELCQNRVTRELKKAKEFRESIVQAFWNLEDNGA